MNSSTLRQRPGKERDELDTGHEQEPQTVEGAKMREQLECAASSVVEGKQRFLGPEENLAERPR